MRDGWNFQNDIALRIERYGRKYVHGEFPTASTIADGEFVDAMLGILSTIYSDLNQLSDFVERCHIFDGKSYNDIEKEGMTENAIELFQDFERLIDNYEKRMAE